MKSSLGIQGNIPLQAGLHPHKGHVGSDRRAVMRGPLKVRPSPDRGGKRNCRGGWLDWLAEEVAKTIKALFKETRPWLQCG